MLQLQNLHMNRRLFLRGAAVALAGFGSAPAWLARAASEPGARKKVLVVIFQRGAADGLNIVVPFAEKRYYELRPTINVPMPGAQNNAGALDLDGHFGLHPALQPLKALWDRNQLAIIEATGSPDPSRSHFDAQDHMESGTPGKTGDGWMNRALPPQASGTAAPLRAIALGAQLPRTLRGDRPAIALNDLQSFNAGNADLLESLYAASPDAQLASAGKDAFAAMKMIQAINKAPYTPAGGAQYGPAGPLGRSLQQIARLIKADAGVEAAFAEMGGWDHHGQEPGQLANQLRQFGAALAAFAQDMGDRMEDVVVVTMSEFGRTAQENGNQGTDHGHGSLMFALGGPIAGGKVYGNWPGLEAERLYENRDLAVTTDYRAVLSELVAGHLGQQDVARVFPGFTAPAPLGLLKG